jgi:Flp pilus assembly protein TadG
LTPQSNVRPKPEPFIRHIGRSLRSARRRAGNLGSALFHGGRWVRDEQGSAILEFAMVAILLLTVVFGVIEIGLALYAYNVVSEAAREGTRFAIVRGSACTSFASACPASKSDIQDYVQYLGYPGIDPSRMTVNTTWSVTNAGTTCSPSPSCNNPGNQVQVQVTYKLPLVLPFLSSQTLSVSNTAQMVISQ